MGVVLWRFAVIFVLVDVIDGDVLVFGLCYLLVSGVCGVICVDMVCNSVVLFVRVSIDGSLVEVDG